MGSKKHMTNRMEEYSGDKEYESFKTIAKEQIDIYLQKIFQHPCFKARKTEDSSIYTGDGGTIVLFLQLFLISEDASRYLKILLPEIPQDYDMEREQSFLEGFAGLYSLAVVITHLEDNLTDRGYYVNKLLLFSEYVLSDDYNGSNELLYGRAGYIQSLLHAYRYTRLQTLLDTAYNVSIKIVKEGRRYSKEIRSKSPLMFSWHDKRYMGMAHGLSGIFHILISVYQLQKLRQNLYEKNFPWWQEVLEDIKSSVHFLSTTVFPSGNYPTRDDGDVDKLVQWCHGAPAMVLLFCKLYEVFAEPEIKELAIRAGNVVWERGLLLKGFGLCHGISGNAYCFLNLFYITGEEKYRSRAWQFCTYAWHDKELLRDLIGAPDAPYSLFEGIGGAVHLCHDLLHNSHTSFPTLEFSEL